jgi:hypothetical protein
MGSNARLGGLADCGVRCLERKRRGHRSANWWVRRINTIHTILLPMVTCGASHAEATAVHHR